MMKNAWLMLLVLAVGCGGTQVESEAPESLGVNTSQIIGGTPTSALPAVVAIYGQKAGEEAGALCTATVIAPTVLLTAAHCVHPDTVGEGVTFTALTGSDITDPAKRTQHEVLETHYNTKWSSQNLPGGHDIAVVILKAPIPNVTPMPFNKTALPATFKNTPARIIGYGLNDGFNQTGAGVKREATVKINSFDDLFVKTGSWFGKTICSGDSGGPIVVSINGVDTVVGVNSFGFIFCLGESSSTRVDTNLDFVSQYVP